jgi:molybdopterin-guanine dinucleotide biosynthesis protein A
VIVGIFVGGKSSRMGGAAKGLLPAPDTGEALVVRSQRLALELGHRPVLVGAADAYRSLLPQLACIADAPGGVGPLGGLGGLLRFAEGQPVIALACDMPYVSGALLSRLTTYTGPADALAARGTTGLWEPLCALYHAARALPRLESALAHGERSFQALFARLTVEELSLRDHERDALRDWDVPDDVLRARETARFDPGKP